ncbi:unnamed protein product, partial [Effrenium voratum]
NPLETSNKHHLERRRWSLDYIFGDDLEHSEGISERGVKGRPRTRRLTRMNRDAQHEHHDGDNEHLELENHENLPQVTNQDTVHVLKPPQAQEFHELEICRTSSPFLKTPRVTFDAVFYTSGAPPVPPKWSYSREDARSFAKFERKVQLWRMQIRAWMPLNEAAMLLYGLLTGEAEDETENLDLEKVNSPGGLDYIMNSLKDGLQSKVVFQKRKLLHDFESVSRYNNESMRSYTSRYRRTEQALQSVGIQVSGMYDEEARGSRLLDRAKLTPESKRLVLIGCGYRLDFASISDSLNMSFPEHKQPPPVVGRDGLPYRGGKGRDTSSGHPGGKVQGAGREKGKGNPFTSKGYSGNKGNGKFEKATVYQTDLVEDDEEFDGEDANQFGDDTEEYQDFPEEGDEHDPGHGEDAQELDREDVDLQGLAQVLTVTARKLSGITLGRKFSGGKRSPQEMKRTTHCSACGALGHWAGDPECTASSKGGKDASKGKSNCKDKGSGAKKVLRILHHDAGSTVVRETEEDQGSMFLVNMTFLVNEVYLGDDGEYPFSNLLVLDTACQRTCCGTRWAKCHEEVLAAHNLRSTLVTTSDTFQFGKGGPVQAGNRRYFPVCFNTEAMKATPPPWLVGWKRLAYHLIKAEAVLILHMVKAVRLGLRNQQRFGNMYGRFARRDRTPRFDGGETDHPAGSRGDAFTTGSGGNGIHFDDLHGFNQGATFIRENEIGADSYGTEFILADEEESDPLETDYDWELEEDCVDIPSSSARRARRRTDDSNQKEMHVMELFAGEASISYHAKQYKLTTPSSPSITRAVGICRQSKTEKRSGEQYGTFDLFQGNRYFVLENPQKSRIWEQAAVERLLDHPGVGTSVFHDGAYGSENSKMEPVIKAFKIASNCNEILEAMLSKEQQHYCTPIEGSETRGSQAYPPGMVHTILKTLQTVSQRRDPQRFGPIYTTWATMPVQDLRSWDPVVTRVDQETSRTSLRPYNIPLESEFGKQIAELTRWNLGALIIYSSGEKELEFEDIALVRFPKQRFSKPVRLAMFFYGTPTEEDLKPEAIEEQHHGLPLPGLPTDITFPTLEKPVLLEVKRSVARLHLNLGHCSAQEMSRMLAYHGTAPLEVIAAVKALECATCKRLQAPQKPRPSTAPRLHIGQCGDELQIDNFYLRTLDSKNHPIMGICDRTTNLHQAVRLQSREPQETLDALVQGWIRPYGLPATVRCDPDGAYMGVFKDWLQ